MLAARRFQETLPLVGLHQQGLDFTVQVFITRTRLCEELPRALPSSSRAAW